MKSRPVIGVTGPDRGGLPAWIFTSWALRIAGAKPVRISPSRPRDPRELDGLVVGGGADVSGPDRPVKTQKPTLPRDNRRWRNFVGWLLAPLLFVLRRVTGVRFGGIDPARDELEQALLRDAERRGLPVLGICRGAQLMNVLAGGTLHRDLANFYREEPQPWTVLPRKRVEVEAGSRLAEVLGVSRPLVNSLHRQAVNDLGADLRVCARESNGVIQAIEHPERRFWLGVQWHPEFLPQETEQRRLFTKLVEAARMRTQALEPTAQRRLPEETTPRSATG